MELLNLNDVRLFLKVVELEGFTAAAHFYKMQKSRVSRRVSALEESIGMRLLERKKTGFSVTQAGQNLVQQYAVLYQQLDIVEHQIHERKSELSGKIQLSLPLNLANTPFSGLLSDFCIRYPKIEIDCELVNQSDRFAEKDFDVAFLINSYELPEGDFIARKLVDIKSGLYASADFITRQGPITKINQLSSLACLCASHSHNYVFTRGKKSISIAVTGPLYVDSSMAQLQAALKGLGIIRSPSFLVEQYVETGELIELKLDAPSQEYQIYMAYKERELLPAKVRAFIDFFIGIRTDIWD